MFIEDKTSENKSEWTVQELAERFDVSRSFMNRRLLALNVPVLREIQTGGRPSKLYSLETYNLLEQKEKEFQKYRDALRAEHVTKLDMDERRMVVDMAFESMYEDWDATDAALKKFLQSAPAAYIEQHFGKLLEQFAQRLPVTLNKINTPLQLTEAQAEAASNAVIDEAYKLAAEMETGVAPDNETTAVACRDTAVVLYVQQPAQRKVVQNIAELIVQANDNLQQEVERTEEARQQVKDADRWLYDSLPKARQEYVDRLRKTEAYRNESVADILSVRRTNKLCAMVGIR